MSILAWLGVPVGATLIAVAWAHWASRPKGPQPTLDSVAAYERFRSAISGEQQGRRRTDRDDSAQRRDRAS